MAKVNIHSVVHISAKNRPWLVLCSGLFADHQSWKDVILLLSPFYHILCYDNRGLGLSDAPETLAYSLEDHVYDLENLLEQHEIDKAYFLGLSNGGRTVLEFARRHPKRVMGICACDTYAYMTTMMRAKLQSWLSANEMGGAEHRFDITTPWIFGETFINQKPELIEYFKRQSAKGCPKVTSRLIRGAMEGDIYLNEISCPVLFVVGIEDILTPPSIHHAMAKMVSGPSRVEVIEGGHASIFENPKAIMDIVHPFFNQLTTQEISYEMDR